MNLRKRLVAFVGAATLLGAITVSGAPGLLAQEATPADAVQPEPVGRPVHIHTGSCGADLGEVIQPLTNLTAPTGQTVGQEAAIVAETSFTTVPLALDAILAEDHAINAHLSQEEAGTYIACGEIGGVVNAQGALVIGLQEQNDSGISGIAFLVPNAADPTQTDVSVFIAEGLAEDGLDAEDDLEDEEDDLEDIDLGTPEA